MAQIQALAPRLREYKAQQRADELVAKEQEFRNAQLRNERASLAQQKKFQQENLAFQNQQQQFAENQAGMQMGLEGAKLGGSILSSGTGKGVLSNILPGGLGGTVGAGLLGAGVGKMLGGKSKGKSALWGGLAGGIGGLMTGGFN
jgi:hypothetical protein